MKNNNHMISGEEYSLKEIFSGKWKVVIPDLQRDYCWGLETYDKGRKSQGELVTQFIHGILEGSKSSEVMTMGLLYGYEEPKGQIQLCDGQQRLTTLYLLLGVLNRENKNQQLESLLMTSYEQEDDQETQLQYAIRESTLYFLSDLVYHYFINKDSDDIEKAEWYYLEYDQDASIQAIISAVRHIEEAIDNYKKEDSADLKALAEFVTNGIKFVYFDMGDRVHGEETFVLINTTGEPLTAAENLKPILIGNLPNNDDKQKFSGEWEDREDWFWRHRNKRQEATSDELSNDFYVWYWQLQLLQERMWKDGKPSDLRPKDLFMKPIASTGKESEEYDSTHRWNNRLENVHRRFKALVLLYDTIEKNSAFKKILLSILGADNKTAQDLFEWLRQKSNIDLLLPLMAFCEKFGNRSDNFKESKDIVMFASRLAKNALDKKYGRVRRNDTESYLDWRYIVQIIEQTDNIENLLMFDTMREGAFDKRIPNVQPACWYDHDEQMKHSCYIFLKQSMSEEQVIETMLKCAMHPIILFDLSVLWSGIENEEWNQDSYNRIHVRFSNLNLLYTCLADKDNQSPVLSNFYRLYRFLCGWNADVGHIYYHTWDASGFYFGHYSYSDVYAKEYNDERFIMLLDSQDILSSLREFVKAQYSESDIEMSRDTFSPEKYLRIWLLLKVLIANEAKEKITYWTDRAIGCYNRAEDNRINENHRFSISNSCAGYIYRDGVRYANKEGYCNPILLDRPLFAPDGIADYDSFKNRQVTDDSLQNSSEYIDRIFKGFITVK